MPRTTDWMHTRQGRWIQKELAFTLAKNATQPNAFKIIPIQSTGKENNRETEETLARAAVTLETERAKWPNPWCLCWWWWCVCLGFRRCSYASVLPRAGDASRGEWRHRVEISQWFHFQRSNIKCKIQPLKKRDHYLVSSKAVTHRHIP